MQAALELVAVDAALAEVGTEVGASAVHRVEPPGRIAIYGDAPAERIGRQHLLAREVARPRYHIPRLDDDVGIGEWGLLEYRPLIAIR
jgi:hypothetical protein